MQKIDILLKKIEQMKTEYKDILEQREKRVKSAYKFEKFGSVPVIFTLSKDWWARKEGISLGTYLNHPQIQFTEELKKKIYQFENLHDDTMLDSELVIDVGMVTVEASVIGCRIGCPGADQPWEYPWVDLTWSPLSGPEDIKRFEVPTAEKIAEVGVIKKIIEFAKFARKEGLSVKSVANGEGPASLACWAYGYEKFLMMLVEAPALAHELLTKMTQTRIEVSRFLNNLLGIKDNNVGEHFIESLSLEQFKEFVLPYDRQVFEALEGERIFHTDACADRFLDMITTLGITRYQVSETTDLKKAKKVLGEKGIVIKGGIPTGLLCRQASEEEIEKVVKECIEVAAHGGGYIMGTDSLMHDTREECLQSVIKFCRERRL